MPTASKKEIVLAVANKTGRPSAEVSAVCQSYLDQIVEELAKGNRLEFREFGVFELKRRKERTARNPKTGEAVHVPARTVVSFKPGRLMKQRVVDVIPT
ncbi:MAG: integration host factor subunit beta [Planctomycetota bacterium]|nr:MAG: integration host factor subunit beta [Planctomycetota bacterium]